MKHAKIMKQCSMTIKMQLASDSIDEIKFLDEISS
jgi:hypothetical protein